MMKATGIVRKVDGLGRVVIPKELRSTMDIDINAPLEFFVEHGKIILRKYEPACVFCGNAEGASEYKGKKVCVGCIVELQRVVART